MGISHKTVVSGLCTVGIKMMSH